MSFIGAGELEHKVSQLQRQLDHKDHELNSIKNEQRKREEDLGNARRAKEDAEYKLRDEADRAHQAEKSITAKATEISQLKLKLSNLESSLNQATDKLRKEEKDKERIQDALDEALNSGTDGASQQVKSLRSRTKQLEEALRSSEQEKEKLRSQGSSNDPWGSGEPLTRGERNRLMVLQNQVESLREENARLQASGPSKPSSSDMFASSSPSRPKTKGRSMSVSAPAPSELIEMEKQISSLKDQLAICKKDLDKAVNEKLAVEITSKKKMEKMQGDMDDIKEELDFYRRNQNGNGVSSKQEIEKIKKALTDENDKLQIQLKAKNDEVAKHVQQIQHFENQIESIERPEADLEREKNLRQSLEASKGDSSVSPNRLEEAEETIQSLRAELAKARSTSATTSTESSSKGGDMEIRQVKRELQKALRDKEYLEGLVKENDELLAEKDEEIQRMKTAIPVPSSPVLRAKIDDTRLQELEETKMVLEEKIEEQKERYEEEIKGIESRLEMVTKEVDAVKISEKQLAERLAMAQEEVETHRHQQVSSETQLESLSEKLASKETEILSLNAQLPQLRADLDKAQDAYLIAQQDIESTRNRLQELEVSLDAKEKLLDDLSAQRDELESTLATRSRDDADFTLLENALKGAQAQLAEVEIALTANEGERAKLQESLAAARLENDLSSQQVSDLSANLVAVEKQLDEVEERARTLSQQKDETIQSLNDELDDLRMDVSSLQIKLDDKIAELAVSTMSHDKLQDLFDEAMKSLGEVQAKLSEAEEAQADRSTATEARHKDEELFQLKEEKAQLSQMLQSATEEFQEELAAVTFKGEQDLLEAQGRVQKLEKQVEDLQSDLSSLHNSKSSITSDSETVHRLEQKISQLRSERDDLRHNLSFVQNERHFAIRAANTDKEAALEDVRKVKDEIKQSNMACERLRVELEEAKIRLAENASKVNEIDDEERQQLVERVSSLEVDLSNQTEKVKSLESQLKSREEALSDIQGQLQKAEKRAEGLQKELLEMVNHVGQTTKLSDPPRHSPTSEDTSDLPTDLIAAMNDGEPRSRRTSLGHMRSRSNMSANMLQNLNIERQLQAKIARRDARIAELTHDLEKANLNLTLAKEAQEETLEEITELVEERDRLQAELRQSTQRIEQVQIQVENPEALRAMVLALVMYRQSTKSAESRWNVASEMLSRSRNAATALRAHIDVAEHKSNEDAQRVQSLEWEKTALETQVAALQAEGTTSRFQLDEARKSLSDLPSRLSTYEAASLSAAESTAALSAMEVQVAEREERIRELKAQNMEYTARIEVLEGDLAELKSSRDEDLTTLNSKISELERELKDSQDKVKEFGTEKEGLAEDINAAERALEEGMNAASAEQEKMEKKCKEVEVRVAELEGQLREKVTQLEEMTRKCEEVERDLETAKNRMKDMTTASEEDQATVHKLRGELDVLKESSQGNSEVVTELREQLATLQTNSKTVEEERKALTMEIIQLKEFVSSANDQRDLTGKQLDNTVIELEDARKAKEMVDELEHRNATESSLEEITNRMEQLSVELNVTKVDLVEKTQALQNALTASEEQQAELERLRLKNLDLKVQLEKAQSAASFVEVDEELVADLKERIEQLESSLTQKTEEVDEADDRTREAFKTNAKLEKKLGKLQRQLEAAQVEKNTALNKLATQAQAQPRQPAVTSSSSAPTIISAAVVAPAPAPAPTPTQSVAAAPPTTTKPRVVSAPSPIQRTPLSSVNIFQPSSNTHDSSPIPTSGHKRHREDDPVKPYPTVDAILQPPSMKSISPHRPKSSFTPQRGISTHGHTQVQGNLNLDIAKQRPAFPLPPTRSVFQPR
nr:uncharacterized protein I203_04349 [Kwoniella mangroviensis CBS 8507]OCF66772.1 hypothetical protein I203_04349 [Kwoniella mangroviensis CBS 8507]